MSFKSTKLAKVNNELPEDFLITNIDRLEETGQPKLIKQCFNHWPAVQRWKGQAGLQRLIELAGDAQVDVMLSSTTDTSVFSGEITQLFTVETTLTEFLTGNVQRKDDKEERLQPKTYPTYLAQTPILSSRTGFDKATILENMTLNVNRDLYPLVDDIQIPMLFSGSQRALEEMNLWISKTETTSSIHYDPYYNLLVVVQGRKEVTLMWPGTNLSLPNGETTPCRAAYEESANHLPVEKSHTLLRSFTGSKTYVLTNGDALFIPEGWWHQVHSDPNTIGINFWWQAPAVHSVIYSSWAKDDSDQDEHLLCKQQYHFRQLAEMLSMQTRQEVITQVLDTAKIHFQLYLMDYGEKDAIDRLMIEHGGAMLAMQHAVAGVAKRPKLVSTPGSLALGAASSKEIAQFNIAIAALMLFEGVQYNENLPGWSLDGVKSTNERNSSPSTGDNPPRTNTINGSAKKSTKHPNLVEFGRIAREHSEEMKAALLHGNGLFWEIITRGIELGCTWGVPGYREDLHTRIMGDIPSKDTHDIDLAVFYEGLYGCVEDMRLLTGVMVERKNEFNEYIMLRMLQKELGCGKTATTEETMVEKIIKTATKAKEELKKRRIEKRSLV